MRRTLSLLLALSLSTFPLAAPRAEQVIQVTTCGTSPLTLKPGASATIYVDANGNVCISGVINATTVIPTPLAVTIVGTPISVTVTPTINTTTTITTPLAVYLIGTPTAVTVTPAIVANTVIATPLATYQIGTPTAVTIASGADFGIGTQSDAAYNGSGNASVIAALKGLYTAVTAAVATGTNVIGGFFNSLSTTGGWTVKLVSSLGVTPQQIVLGVHQFGKLYCDAPNAAEVFVQVFNATPVTIGTTVPIQSYGIEPGVPSGFDSSPVGDQYNTAIVMAATTTAGGNVGPSTLETCNVSYN